MATVWFVFAALSMFELTTPSLIWEILTWFPIPICLLGVFHFFFGMPLTIRIDEEALIFQRGGLIPQRPKHIALREICGLQMITCESEPAEGKSGNRRRLEIELRQGTCVTIDTPRSGEIASLLREQTGIPLKERIRIKS